MGDAWGSLLVKNLLRRAQNRTFRKSNDSIQSYNRIQVPRHNPGILAARRPGLAAVLGLAFPYGTKYRASTVDLCHLLAKRPMPNSRSVRRLLLNRHANSGNRNNEVRWLWTTSFDRATVFGHNIAL
jgi:hypothetical protein